MIKKHSSTKNKQSWLYSRPSYSGYSEVKIGIPHSMISQNTSPDTILMDPYIKEILRELDTLGIDIEFAYSYGYLLMSLSTKSCKKISELLSLLISHIISLNPGSIDVVKYELSPYQSGMTVLARMLNNKLLLNEVNSINYAPDNNINKIQIIFIGKPIIDLNIPTSPLDMKLSISEFELISDTHIALDYNIGGMINIYGGISFPSPKSANSLLVLSEILEMMVMDRLRIQSGMIYGVNVYSRGNHLLFSTTINETGYFKSCRLLDELMRDFHNGNFMPYILQGYNKAKQYFEIISEAPATQANWYWDFLFYRNFKCGPIPLIRWDRNKVFDHLMEDVSSTNVSAWKWVYIGKKSFFKEKTELDPSSLIR